jgi:hypothetical protein
MFYFISKLKSLKSSLATSPLTWLGLHGTPNQSYARVVLIVFSATAVLYNSWPLGYLLNSKTARYGLASGLDAGGQPYDWLFILGDCLVGLSLLAICVLIRLKLRHALWSKSWSAVFMGLVVFGLLTATSAASPSHCTSGTFAICGTFGKRAVGPDGLESTVAALGLLVSLVGINILNRHYQLSVLLRRASQCMLVAWLASGLGFLIIIAEGGNAHLAQQVLLIVSGLALVIIGLNVMTAIERQSEKNRLSSNAN